MSARIRPPSPDMAAKASIIYVIGSTPDKPVKIGLTYALSKRLKGIQTGSADKLRVMRTVPGALPTEEWFHERFGHLRINGEWFTFDPEMLTVEPPVFATEVGYPKPRPVGCKLVAQLVGVCGGYEEVAKAANISPDTVKTWALDRRKPGFDVMAELMVHHPALLEMVTEYVETRRSEITLARTGGTRVVEDMMVNENDNPSDPSHMEAVGIMMRGMAERRSQTTGRIPKLEERSPRAQTRHRMDAIAALDALLASGFQVVRVAEAQALGLELVP